jgi:hypothetical protein
MFWEKEKEFSFAINELLALAEIPVYKLLKATSFTNVPFDSLKSIPLLNPEKVAGVYFSGGQFASLYPGEQCDFAVIFDLYVKIPLLTPGSWDG